MLVHLAHVLLHAHLHVKLQALCKVGQGLAQQHLHVGVGAARRNAHGPVDGGESGHPMTRL